jgi:hypothetical protein
MISNFKNEFLKNNNNYSFCQYGNSPLEYGDSQVSASECHESLLA